MLPGMGIHWTLADLNEAAAAADASARVWLNRPLRLPG